MARIKEAYLKMLEGDVNATMHYAELVAAQGETQEAYNTINKISDEVFGTDYEGLKHKYELMGKLLMKLKKYDLAVTAFENVRELDGTDVLMLLVECYSYLGRDLTYVETLAKDDDIELLYIIACTYAGKYHSHMRNSVRAKLYFERIKENKPDDKLLLAKCESWLAYANHLDRTRISEEALKVIKQGRESGDEECITLCKEIEQVQQWNKDRAKITRRQKVNKVLGVIKKGFRLFSLLPTSIKIIIAIIIFALLYETIARIIFSVLGFINNL